MNAKIEKLMVLADKLDAAGKYKEADIVDELVKSAVSEEDLSNMTIEQIQELIDKKVPVERQGPFPESVDYFGDKDRKKKEDGPIELSEEDIEEVVPESEVAPKIIKKEPSSSPTTRHYDGMEDIYNREQEIERQREQMRGHTKMLEQKLTEEVSPGVTTEQRDFLKNLSDGGWDIFAPGDLNIWLKELGYEKIRDLVGLFSEEELDKLISEKEMERRSSLNKETIEKLAHMADKLDEIGEIKSADMIDEFIGKYAKDEVDHYDSGKHHSMQIREPKTKQERVDREKREKHHVHTYQPKDGTLSSRYCPDHTGVTMARVGDNTYQCPLDGAIYNWETGWTDHDGNEHPGSSVAGQTPMATEYAIPHRVFDSRENILNTIN